MRKLLVVYLIFALMLATSALYFVAATLGENFEPGIHEAKAATETGQESTGGAPQHESTETSHMTTGTGGEQPSSSESSIVASSTIQEKNNTLGSQQKHEQIQKEATESHDGIVENNIGSATESSNEVTKRSLELPLFLTAGIAYAIVGVWILKDKNYRRIPYIISTAGSLILIGLYVASHTVGLPLIGLEHVGVLDLLIAALQVAIIGFSPYIILSLSGHKITRSAERSA